jgi:hypothetical protein
VKEQTVGNLRVEKSPSTTAFGAFLNGRYSGQMLSVSKRLEFQTPAGVRKSSVQRLEFQTPAGVRKSSVPEPAVCRR